MKLLKLLPGWIKYYGSLLVGKLLGRRIFWNIEALLKPKDAILSGCESDEEFYNQGNLDVQYLESLNLLNPETISLHIGCGIGRMEKFIAPKVKEAYGIDVSKVMINKAKSLVSESNAHFICNNGTDLKVFDNNTLTLIYSFFVFQHFSRATARGYMAEVARVLKPDGNFLCQFQYKGEEEAVNDPPEDHPWGIRLYNINDINELAHVAKLNLVKIHNLDEARSLRAQGVEHGKCNVWALFNKPSFEN